MSPSNSFGPLTANPCSRWFGRCCSAAHRQSMTVSSLSQPKQSFGFCSKSFRFGQPSFKKSATSPKISRRAWSGFANAEFVQEDLENRNSKRSSAVVSKVSEETSISSTTVRPERIYVQSLTVNPLEVERIHEENQTDFRSEDCRFSEDESVSVPPREQSACEEEAWGLLRDAVVNYCGSPIGTVAANNPCDSSPLNYDQVFIRDFVPSALAFMLNGETEIVRNFLLHNLQLQSWEKTVDCYSPGQGLMPASFKVRTVPLDGNNKAFEEILDPDFGESTIGRVAPVDSGLWWIIILRAYGKITGDYTLQERVDVQTGIKLILKLCLADGFDMFPTLLVTDGSCMIDRRMGIHGHPLEIQGRMERSSSMDGGVRGLPISIFDDICKALLTRCVWPF